MKNDFSDKIKSIEEELLALKTNSQYTMARGFTFSSPTVSSTGVYRITYRSQGEQILSSITSLYPWNEDVARIWARTPIGDTQDVEVSINPNWSGVNVYLSVTSNYPIVSIQKIS